MGPFPKHITFRNVLITLLFSFGVLAFYTATLWAYVLVFLIAFTISYFGTTQISSNFHMPAFCNIKNHKKKEIALTFDDGITNADRSKTVLNILKKYNVSATFFCIGKNLQTDAQIEVLKRMDTEGHIIGNHSYSHSNFYDFYSSKQVTADALKTDVIIEQHIGKKPLFYRPPYGITTPNIAKAIKSTDYKTIGWSLRSLDTVIKDPETMLKRVKQKLKNGDILLFHDHVEYMPIFLPIFLEHLLNKGYRVVGVDELMNFEPYKTDSAKI